MKPGDPSNAQCLSRLKKTGLNPKGFQIVSKLKFRIVICIFSFQNSSWMQFLSSGSAQTRKNHFQFHEFGHFLYSKSKSKSRLTLENM